MNLAFRQDFGFGNPNTAAAFLAMLLVAIVYVRARGPVVSVIRWGSGSLCLAALLLTSSRGGFLALAGGLTVAWAAAGFPRPRWASIVLAGSVATVLVVTLGARSVERVSQLSPSEGSTASRLEIYSTIPAMLASAPGGWGFGQAGSAYGNWFQDTEDTRSFKNLLSTHGTWIVEGGWMFTLCYLVLWAVAFALAWISPPAVGVLVVAFVAAALSHTGGDPRLWVLPAGAMAWAIFRRVSHPPPLRPLLLAFCVAFGSAVALILTGYVSRPGIHFDGHVVRVGDEAPTRWFLAPDPRVLGTTYGKPIRDVAPAAVTWNPARIPRNATVVLTGKPSLTEFGAAPRHLIWINPPGDLTEVEKNFVAQTEHVKIFWGALRNDASPTALYRWIQRLRGAEWTTLRGQALFSDQSRFIVARRD